MLRLALRSPCSPNERRTNSVAPFPTSRARTKFSAPRRPASHQRQVPPTGVLPSSASAHINRDVWPRVPHIETRLSPGDRPLAGSHSAPGSELPSDYEPLPPVTIAPYNQMKAPATSKKRAHGEIGGDEDLMAEDEVDDDDVTLVV